MIKINLLPVRQDRRREAGRNQVAIAIGIIAVELAVFFFLQMSLDDQIAAQKNANASVQTQVERIRKQIADHPQILKEIEEFEKRQEAIESLQAARTGPVYVMLELSRVLSKEGRPTIDPERYQQMIQLDPASGYDEGWDYRRVWISAIREEQKIVQLTGQASTHEDVAEFLRRLNLSDFFVTTTLVRTDLKAPQVPGVTAADLGKEPVVHFVIDAQVRYK